MNTAVFTSSPFGCFVFFRLQLAGRLVTAVDNDNDYIDYYVNYNSLYDKKQTTSATAAYLPDR